jgi:hypothetical protein
MRTPWELDENIFGEFFFKYEKTHPPPNPKEKNCALLFVKPSPWQHENCDFSLGQYLSLTL